MIAEHTQDIKPFAMLHFLSFKAQRSIQSRTEQSMQGICFPRTYLCHLHRIDLASRRTPILSSLQAPRVRYSTNVLPGKHAPFNVNRVSSRMLCLFMKSRGGSGRSNGRSLPPHEDCFASSLEKRGKICGRPLPFLAGTKKKEAAASRVLPCKT